MFSDARSGGVTRFSEQGVGFAPSFDCSGLDAPGTIAHPLLGDEDKQAIELVVVVDTLGVLSPSDPDLHSVLETELARQAMGKQGGLGHHQTNEIVGEQVDPDFLDCHCGGLATELFHPQSGLDVA